jgi:hypothetical protein
MVFEIRPGVHAGYTSRGNLAYVTSSALGAEPLARLPAAGRRAVGLSL